MPNQCDRKLHGLTAHCSSASSLLCPATNWGKLDWAEVAHVTSVSHRRWPFAPSCTWVTATDSTHTGDPFRQAAMQLLPQARPAQGTPPLLLAWRPRPCFSLFLAFTCALNCPGFFGELILKVNCKNAPRMIVTAHWARHILLAFVRRRQLGSWWIWRQIGRESGSEWGSKDEQSTVHLHVDSKL